MKNKKKISITAALLAITLLSYGIFASGALAFDNGLLGSKKYGQHTYIGPFAVSDMKEKDVKDKLSAEFSSMKENLVLNLIYQDVTIELPSEVISFDVEESIKQAVSDGDNKVIAHASVGGLSTVLQQQFAPISFSDEDIAAIALGIEEKLESGIMPVTIHVTDYLQGSSLPKFELASSSVSTEDVTPQMMNLLNVLNGKEIQSLSSFSLLEYLQENANGPIVDEDLTVLASLLYNAVLQTNFVVDERNISSIVNPNVPLGFEAAVNQQYNLDFKFTNPNKSSFTIWAKHVAGTIRIDIEGLPLIFTYEPYVANVETFKPRTVKQYSVFAKNNKVIDEGKDGAEVLVQRNVSYQGKVYHSEFMSSDFYAPQPKIEQYPMNSDDTITSRVEPDEILSRDDSDTNSNDLESNPNNLPSEDLYPEDVQYDKGGNIIK